VTIVETLKRARARALKLLTDRERTKSREVGRAIAAVRQEFYEQSRKDAAALFNQGLYSMKPVKKKKNQNPAANNRKRSK
jgi:hypothetical protein